MRGTITGKGANYIIIDDPHKPEEVLSPMIRNADNEWVENTLLSRLDNQNDGRIIVVMQRLHINDLTGYLIEKGGWEVLSIAAISTEKKYYDIKMLDDSYSKIERIANEPILPQIANLESLQRLKLDIGLYNFEAQYQQNPISEEGISFRE
jgi:hypothetical protein